MSLKDRLRVRLLNWLTQSDAQPASSTGFHDQVAVDAHTLLPVYLAPPECPECLKLKPSGTCDDCGCEIPVMSNMYGHGYQSQSATHMHLFQSASGHWMREKAFRELCTSCYREDWPRVYPAEPCPI